MSHGICLWLVLLFVMRIYGLLASCPKYLVCVKTGCAELTAIRRVSYLVQPLTLIRVPAWELACALGLAVQIKIHHAFCANVRDQYAIFEHGYFFVWVFARYDNNPQTASVLPLFFLNDIAH